MIFEENETAEHEKCKKTCVVTLKHSFLLYNFDPDKSVYIQEREAEGEECVVTCRLYRILMDFYGLTGDINPGKREVSLMDVIL